MKLHWAHILLALAVLLSGCTGGKGTAEGSDADSTHTENDVADNEQQPEEGGAVIIYDGIGLYAQADDPAAKGNKWVTSMSLGETVSPTGESEKHTVNGKERTYVKVKTKGDQTGWVWEDLLALSNQPMAVITKLQVYSRPDLVATRSNTYFEPFDVVAVLKTEGDWVQVKGKRRKGQWPETVWVKNRGLSADDKDLAVATLASRALREKATQKRIDMLNDINTNSDFTGHSLSQELNAAITELTAGDAAGEHSATALDSTSGS